MNRSLFTKLVSLTLIFATVLSIVSCGKKGLGNAGRKVMALDPWFDAKVYSIEPYLDSDGKEIEYKAQKLAGSDDNYIVVFSYGYYAHPVYSEEYDSSDYSYYLVTVVDRNTGDMIDTINLNKYISGNGFIMDVEYVNDIITSTVYFENESGGGILEVDNDVLTGEKLCERNLGKLDGSSGSKSRFKVGQYNIIAEQTYDLATCYSYFCLKITSSEGSESHVELKKERTGLWYIPIIMPIDEGKILVPITQTSTNNPVLFEIDVNKSQAIEVNINDYDWIDFGRITTGYGSKDGYAYFATSVGISKIDIKNKKIEEFFNYNACPLNNALLSNTEIIDCYDNNIILLGGRYSSFSLEDSSKIGFDIYYLSKASENPNAGKTILELYSNNGYVDQTIAEAIVRFNETYKDYYIEVIDRYMLDEYQHYMQTDSLDEVEKIYLQSNVSLNDKLAMDIMNGVGPDILILSGDMGRLYNSNYLVDLSKYIEDLDSDRYFTNIIKAARVDGKLYQLPVTFGIKGIHTNSKYAGASGYGFTTDEYEDFLYGPLNGYDINETGQAVYFTALFNGMIDKFIINGKADFSDPSFLELADFVKNNVREKAPAYDSEEESDDRRYQNERIAHLTTYYGIKDYFVGVKELQGARAILGLPSADGRGPMIRSTLSVAVSAQAECVDACVEFARILLTDEVQDDLAKTSCFTISRNAYRKSGSLTLDYCNGSRGNSEFGVYRTTGESVDNRIIFTEDDVMILEKIILSCSHFDSVDAAVNIILMEEMPAYFLDQKDLDSVIIIVQDRVQKVLDERG